MKNKLRLVLVAAVAIVATALLASGQKAEVMRNLSLFNSLYKELNTFYVDSIDADKSIETAIVQMLDEIDPYTEYISAKDVKDFESTTTGEYAGIGSFIVQRGKDVFISGPRPGSPAQKAGLLCGDRIVKVDNDTVLGMTVSQVSKRLKGTPGTDVAVTVWRPYVGADSVKTFNITRGKIFEKSVPFYGVLPDSIGIIELTSFTESTPDDFLEAFLEIKKTPGLKGLIIDLRSNGGGLLESAIKVLGYILPKNTEVLRTRGKALVDEKVYKTSGRPLDTKLPIAILTNGGTASAAEIVSGAVQDLDRGVIVGLRTYGKGLVQTTRQLPYGNMLKLTISKYYIPSGRLIQAIDYSRRNPDGSVARIPDSLTTVFHTANGREVRDGGGITPDDTISLPYVNRLMYNLVSDYWFFDYANKFKAEHPDLKFDPATFVITDSIYEDFKKSINPATFKYDYVCEQGLDALKELAKQEGYMNDSTAAAFETLGKLLHHDLNHDLDVNRKMIDLYLSGEIAERYAGDAGRSRVELNYDPTADRARQILKDKALYQQILKPKKKK